MIVQVLYFSNMTLLSKSHDTLEPCVFSDPERCNFTQPFTYILYLISGLCSVICCSIIAELHGATVLGLIISHVVYLRNEGLPK